MIRTVCLRALALVPVSLLGCTGSVAFAGQPEPAAQNGQADAKQNSQAQTPAQQKYGIPRNPTVGGVVDIDLTKPLTLQRAVGIALQRQNSIDIARAQRDADNSALTQARSSFFPTLTPGFTYSDSIQPNSSSPFVNIGTGNSTQSVSNGIISGNNSRSLYRSLSRNATSTSVSSQYTTFETRTESIIAQLTLLDSGQRAAEVGFARRTLFSSEYNIADTRQTVIEATTDDYYTLLRDKALVKVQQINVQLAQTTLDSINAQVQAGNAAQSDTLQAQSSLANAQVSLLQAQNDAATAEATLKNEMGVVSITPLVIADENVPTPELTADSNKLEHYVQIAYDKRMNLKEQQEVVNAQGYNVKLAQINAGLNLNATINEGYQIDPAPGETRTLSVALSYPLFDGYKSRAVVEQNKSELEIQRRTLDLAEQNVRLNVEQDFLTREVSRQQVKAAQVAVTAGQTNYDAALEKQKNGVINILDVITAQVQLVTAQQDLINAIYNFYIADANLIRDIGQNDPDYVPNVPGVHRRPTPKMGSATSPKMGSATSPKTGSATSASGKSASASTAVSQPGMSPSVVQPVATDTATTGRRP